MQRTTIQNFILVVLVFIVLPLFQLFTLNCQNRAFFEFLEASNAQEATAPILASRAATTSINTQLTRLPNMPRGVEDALRTIRSIRQSQNSLATFVQVGANNGVFYDPLYPVLREDKTAWVGLQVEPQPELFSELAVLHADAPGWSFYNGVLATQDECQNGLVTFCLTKTPGIGSFKTQGQLNGIREKCPEDTMVQVSRPCESSWKNLIYQHGGPVLLDYAYRGEHSGDGPQFLVDFLQIDTEGKDYDLLRMLDFEHEMKPPCIHFEHTYGGNAAREEMWSTLKAMGYSLLQHKGDTLACLVEE